MTAVDLGVLFGTVGLTWFLYRQWLRVRNEFVLGLLQVVIFVLAPLVIFICLMILPLALVGGLD